MNLRCASGGAEQHRMMKASSKPNKASYMKTPLRARAHEPDRGERG